ncbi:MAG: MCE family protein [Verrucomicrobia bacterium]|nr:MCE family protein [Verrucomicrobiota bacterium]
MNNSQQTARVGLFFLLGVALIWVTFETLSGGKVFKDKGYELIAGFESLQSLKEGDEIRMAGVRIGEVKGTRLAPSGRRAEAILRIDTGVKIRADATATIVMSGLIGTNFISVDLGTATAGELRPGAEIRTKATPDLGAVMEKLSSLGTKLEDALGSLSGALSGDANNPGLIKKVDTLVTENREKIGATMTNLQQVTDRINKGEGTLGRLVNDPKLHDELLASVDQIKAAAGDAKNFVANAQTIIDQVKSGKGPLGTLVFDEKVSADLRATTQNLRALSDKIARGEGAIGKLLTDDSLVKDAKAVLKKADRALDGFDDAGPITAVGVVARGLF